MIMGRKRKIFTKREFDKLSKTHDGRLKIYSTYRGMCIVYLILGILLTFIGAKFISMLIPIGIILIIGSIIAFLIFCYILYNEKEEEKQRIEQIQKEIEAENRRIEQEKKERDRLEKIRQERLRLSKIEDIDLMQGFEFEEFISLLFRDLGYISKTTKKSGDFGADVILIKDNKRIVVQTKRHSKKISVSAIQEINTSKNLYQAQEAWVITNNYFTDPAKQLASANNVKLIDRDCLVSLILDAKRITELHQNIKISLPSPPDLPATPIYSNYVDEEETFDLEEDHEYNNLYSRKIYACKKKAFDAFNERNVKGVCHETSRAENIQIKSSQNKISLYFFYIDIAKLLHTLNSFDPTGDEAALQICEKSFALLPLMKENDRHYSCPTATIACIILERKKEFQKVIEYCDFFESMNANETSGKSFLFRKDRILKKIN